MAVRSVLHILAAKDAHKVSINQEITAVNVTYIVKHALIQSNVCYAKQIILGL